MNGKKYYKPRHTSQPNQKIANIIYIQVIAYRESETRKKIWGPAGDRIQDPLKSGLYLANQEKRALTGLDVQVHLELEVNMLAILFGNLLLCPQHLPQVRIATLIRYNGWYIEAIHV